MSVQRWLAFSEAERAQIAVGLVSGLVMIATDRKRPAAEIAELMLTTITLIDEIGATMDVDPVSPAYRERLQLIIDRAASTN